MNAAGANGYRTGVALAYRTSPIGGLRIAIVALSALLAFVWESPARAQNPELPDNPSRGSIKVDVDLVMLHVTVIDRSGRPFMGLKAENFRLYDNGSEQAIHHFTTEDLPFTMGLVLDRSGSMSMVIDEVYQAAFHTIRASKPEDEFFIFTFNHELQRRQEFTTDRKILEKRLKGVAAEGRTALYDAVLAALNFIRGGRHDKKALLVVTDGADNSSESSFRELLERVRQENVTIYVVGFFGEESKYFFLRGEGELRTHLTQLAEVAGGRAYFPRTMEECDQVCIAIAHELRQQYGLGYYPLPKVRDGSWHSVQIQLQLPPGISSNGLTARTRAGYFAPREQERKP
jgi:Ca-activated chloride channel family protein